MYGKYRGGTRIRYAFGIIERLDNILYMVLLALLYTKPKLQTVLISSWAIFGVTFCALVSPYNSFQKNFNMILTSCIKFGIFFISTLNGLIGRRSKDVAGPFR